MATRKGYNPKRRIAEPGRLTPEQRTALADKLGYEGSAHHKRSPGNYGFQPPVNPRPWKSLCDGRRSILFEEARDLLRAGICKGMFSEPEENGQPKYIWVVDHEGEVFEAKIGSAKYHGYRLEEDDDMRDIVLKEWKARS